MNLLNYKTETLKYILPYLRANEDIEAILKAAGERYNGLQDAIAYLLNSLKISEARGIWLDKIGAEIGAQRDEKDFGNYFCVNRPHINTEKLFYFLTSGLNPEQPMSLDDAEFIQKILAYIGANSSCATRNEIIAITKTITNAQDVIVKKIKKGVLSIELYGDGLIVTKNTISYIQRILTDGVYLEEIKINGKTS